MPRLNRPSPTSTPTTTMSSAIQRASLRALRNARPLTRAASASNNLNNPATTATTTPDDPDPQLAGYPQLPNVSRQTLPARGWWDMQMRRNMGDTVRLPCPRREREY